MTTLTSKCLGMMLRAAANSSFAAATSFSAHNVHPAYPNVNEDLHVFLRMEVPFMHGACVKMHAAVRFMPKAT
jgi:hypothetical protein